MVMLFSITKGSIIEEREMWCVLFHVHMAVWWYSHLQPEQLNSRSFRFKFQPPFISLSLPYLRSLSTTTTITTSSTTETTMAPIGNPKDGSPSTWAVFASYVSLRRSKRNQPDSEPGAGLQSELRTSHHCVVNFLLNVSIMVTIATWTCCYSRSRKAYPLPMPSRSGTVFYLRWEIKYLFTHKDELCCHTQ